MVRPIRIEYPGAWYHVTCRGNERQNIFRDDADRSRFLEILADNLDRYHVKLHAYVLMSNHFHLLLQTPDGNLKHFMQRFNTTYTVAFNRRHRRSGHLYQGRYKSILVQSDAYLLELSRYLHLNPVRIRKNASLPAKERLALLKQYRWSSFAGYVNLRKQEDFVTYPEVLGMIGGDDIATSRRRHRSFVEAPIRQGEKIEIWENLQGQAVLGDERFMEWLYDKFIEKKGMNAREQPGLKDFGPGPEQISTIAQAVAKEYGVEEAALYQCRGSNREARAVFLELCCRLLTRKTRLADLGEQLGGITSAALCQNRKRLAARMDEDPALRKRVERMLAVWS